MSVHIYLAGGITGLTELRAKAWRAEVSAKLWPMVGVSPLRCEPAINGKYDPKTQSADILFGSPKVIKAKNFLDCQMCDVMLAYIPVPSTGTFIELGWADALGKPLIVVSDNPAIVNHPVVAGVADWLVPTLEDAIKVIKGVFDVYAD